MKYPLPTTLPTPTFENPNVNQQLAISYFSNPSEYFDHSHKYYLPFVPFVNTLDFFNYFVDSLNEFGINLIFENNNFFAICETPDDLETFGLYKLLENTPFDFDFSNFETQHKQQLIW